jgi:hypothetical protein
MTRIYFSPAGAHVFVYYSQNWTEDEKATINQYLETYLPLYHEQFWPLYHNISLDIIKIESWITATGGGRIIWEMVPGWVVSSFIGYIRTFLSLDTILHELVHVFQDIIPKLL